MKRSLLVVTHNFPRFVGDPAGAFVARLASAASTRDWAVQVLAPGAPGIPVHESRDGVAIHRFAPLALPGTALAYRGDLHLAARASPSVMLSLPGFLFGFWRAFRRLIRERKPDVIHAHWWLPGGLIATASGTPVVVTCHGSDVRLLERSTSARMVAGHVFRRARAVTAVSGFLAADLERHIPGLKDKVEVIYMPVDDAHFANGLDQPKCSPPRLLYAGNLLASKGVDVLLKAFSLLRNDGISCQLRILGEGPDEKQLRQCAASLALHDISWSPFVSQDSMPAEYGAATVTILPTRKNAEGLGLTLVEAQLAGCAVIGSRTGGIPEVIQDGHSGLLIEPDDPEALYRACRIILTDPATRERLAAQGLASARTRFGQASAAANYLNLYDRVYAA